ncbi:MAG: autotransporter domain-containing protein [Methyloprofundus sp.]|nr:autotransporter domain-containing protein [Methyloprofundus sp.]
MTQNRWIKTASILLLLNISSVFAQDIVTTNPSNCSDASDAVTSISDGTSLELINSSIPEWQDLGFIVQDVQPNQDIIVCSGESSSQNAIQTPEEETLDQSASSASVTLGASNIQTNNIYTRLEVLRKYSYAVTPTFGMLGGGASSDEEVSVDEYSILNEKLNIFINGNGGIGEQERTEYSNGFDFSAIGTTLGADYRVTDNLTLGTAFGYTASRTEMSAGSGSTDVDSYSLAFYGSYSLPNSFYLEGMARTGWNHYEGSSTISSGDNQSLTEQATSKYKGNDYSVSLSAGYDYYIKGFNISPFVRYDYMHADVGSYQEISKSSRNTIESQSIDSMRTSLGATLSYIFNTPYAVLIPSIRAEWQHEFMNDSRILSSFRESSPSDITEIRTDSPDRDFANIGAGVSAVFPHGISAFFYYEALLANYLTTAHSFSGGIQYQF